MDSNDANEIEGFYRRPHVEIIEISDDDDDDNVQIVEHRRTPDLAQFSLDELEVKREKIGMELEQIENDAFNGVPYETPLNVNPEPVVKSSIEFIQNDPMENGNSVLSPESTRCSISSGFEEEDNDDYLLDLAMPMFASPRKENKVSKVQFTMKIGNNKFKNLKPVRNDNNTLIHDLMREDFSVFDFNSSTENDLSFTGQFPLHSKKKTVENNTSTVQSKILTSNPQTNSPITLPFSDLNGSCLNLPACSQHQCTPFRSPMNDAFSSEYIAKLYNEEVVKHIEKRVTSTVAEYQEQLNSLRKEVAELKDSNERLQNSKEVNSTKHKDHSHSHNQSKHHSHIRHNKRKIDHQRNDELAKKFKTTTKSLKTSTITSADQQIGYSTANVVKIKDNHSEASFSSLNIVDVTNKLEPKTNQANFGMIPQEKRCHAKTSNRSEEYEQNHSSVNSGDDELLTEIPRKRNTDYALFWNSTKSKICIICSGRYVRMVSHIKAKHEDSEVFVSRISPEMEKKISHGKMTYVKYLKDLNKSILYLKAECVFCEQSRDFPPHYWTDHMRSHTGEYANECMLCQKKICFHRHCSLPAKKTIEHNLYRDILHAFVCRRCNFVQIDEKNMEKHLLEEHRFNKSDISKNYRRFILLPALNDLPFQANPILTEIHISESFGDSEEILQPMEVEQHEQIIHSRIKSVAAAQPPQQKSTNSVHVLENIIIFPASNSTANNISIFEQPQTTQVNKHRTTEFNAPVISETTETHLTNHQMQNEEYLSQENEDASSPPSPATNKYKIGPEEENKLMGVFEKYKESEKHKISVRPWLVEDWAKKPFINLLSQFALYKCMHGNCIFATNDEEMWTSHMNKHLDLINVIQKRRMLNKERRTDHIKFRDCPYCNKESCANFEVNKHMELEHRRSGLQCAHCFYRCIEMDYMILHYESFHPEKEREILVCCDEREFEDRDLEVMKEYIEDHVKKIECCQDDCREEFSCFNSLYTHLVVCHSSEYTCSYCLQSMECNVDIIQDHFKMHEIKEFHCIYCENGFSEVNEIKEHMSLEHASNFLYVAARRSANPASDEDEPQIVYIGDSMSYSDYVLIKCDNFNILNYMDPNELRKEKQLEMIHNQPRNISTRLLEKLPAITFHDENKDFYITHDEYMNLFQNRNQNKEPENGSTITEIVLEPQRQDIENIISETEDMGIEEIPLPEINTMCISSGDINNFYEIENSTYKKQLCKNCSVFLDINDSTEHWKYLDHLMSCNPNRAPKCAHSSVDSMIQHRMIDHSDKPFDFLQFEKNQESFVYKMVQCKFQCSIESCKQQFDTLVAAVKHNSMKHSQYYLDAKVIQEIKVLASNDPTQPVKKVSNESNDLKLCHLFWCNYHGKPFFTKEKVLEHYNEQHLGRDNFEISIKPFCIKMPEDINQDNHRMHVFKCLHCSKYFATLDQIKSHIDRERLKGAVAYYTIHTLMACPKDKIISTFDGLKYHCEQKHQQTECFAVNIVNSKKCGICRSDIPKEELKKHFRCNHKSGDVIRFAVYTSLGLEDVIKSNYFMAPGCCQSDPEMRKFRAIDCVVQHIAKCRRRFNCTKCPEATSYSTSEYIQHCRNHNQTNEEIIWRIQDFKTFKSLTSDMQMYLSNGLMVTKEQIEETPFGEKLEIEISKSITSIFERERSYIFLY